jgi:methionine synthase II (cobalamin-independent)
MYTPVSNALREIGVPQEIIIQVSNAYEGYTTRDRALQKLYAPVSLFRPWKDAKRIPSRQDVYKAMVSYYRDEILRQIDAITSEELRTLTHYQSEA